MLFHLRALHNPNPFVSVFAKQAKPQPSWTCCCLYEYFLTLLLRQESINIFFHLALYFCKISLGSLISCTESSTCHQDRIFTPFFLHYKRIAAQIIIYFPLTVLVVVSHHVPLLFLYVLFLNVFCYFSFYFLSISPKHSFLGSFTPRSSRCVKISRLYRHLYDKSGVNAAWSMV